MPKLEKLRVSFDLDANVLARVLMEQNSGFNIEAYQPAVVKKEVAVEPAGLLEDQSRFTLRTLVLSRLKHTGKPTPLADLQALAANNDRDPKALSNLLWVLCTKGLVRRTSPHMYKITPRGMK